MPQMIDGESYLDVDEVIALLGVKRATLYSYVSRGVLRSYRQAVGRRRLYRRADVAALCAIQAELPAETLSTATLDDGVLRDVCLPDAASWAGDH